MLRPRTAISSVLVEAASTTRKSLVGVTAFISRLHCWGAEAGSQLTQHGSSFWELVDPPGLLWPQPGPHLRRPSSLLRTQWWCKGHDRQLTCTSAREKSPCLAGGAHHRLPR